MFARHDDMKMHLIMLLAAVTLSSCRTAIDWPVNGPCPTVSPAQIDALPQRITTADVVHLFGPGLADPNALMVMTYLRSNGGEYLFTWYPTADMPKQTVAEIRTEREMLQAQIQAVLQIESEEDKLRGRMTYAYPQSLKGMAFTGWQDGPQQQDKK